MDSGTRAAMVRAMPGASPRAASAAPSSSAARCRACSAPRSCARSAGMPTSTSARSVELVGRGAGITTHPELLDALEASGAGTKRSRHRGAQAHRDRPAGPHHRRAAAAADPDLVGPPAAAAARDHRSGALSSRLGFRARRAERQRRARAFHRRPRRARRHPDRRRRHPLRACAAQVAPELQPIYAGYYIWRGAPNEADLSPQTLKEIFPLFRVLPAAAAGGDHLPDRGLQRRPAARPPPLQFHLVSRRRRRHAARDERRRERHAARILGAAAADPQGPDRADARRRARDHAAGCCSTA